MPATLTAFDGTSLGSATPYEVGSRLGSDLSYSASVALRGRTDQVPLFEARQHNARTVPFQVTKGSTAPDTTTWQQNAMALFSPFKPARTLQATYNGVTMTVEAEVTRLRVRPTVTDGSILEGEFLIRDPVWRSTTTDTDAATPLSNSGNFYALPTITLTPTTTTVRRRRVTITDNTGRGLANHMVKVTFDASGVSASAVTNFIVFFEGRSVPFYSADPGDAAMDLFFRVDVPPGGSAVADVYYGSSIANSATSNYLHTAGLDLGSATWTNSNVEWNSGFKAPAANPQAAFSWKETRAGASPVSVSHQITTQNTLIFDPATKTWSAGGLAFVIKISTTETFDNSGDALVMVCGVPAGTTNALSGLSRALDVTGLTAGSAKAFIRYRTAGSGVWLDAWTTTTGGTTTTAVDLDNAVAILVGLEPNVAAMAGTAVLTLDLSGTFALALNTSYTPTVSVAAATTARVITGTLTNTTTGDEISFPSTLVDDVALTINCLTQRVTAASGPIYNPPGFSNQAGWLPLAAGSNAWTGPTNATVSIAWKAAYVI